MTRGTMMDHPLSVQMVFDRGERLFGQSAVSGFNGERLAETSFAAIADRARRFASALAALQLTAGDRVGTYCWNTVQHLEAYLAVPSMGCVLHTLNVRLAADQLEYIVDHGGDRALLVDADLLDARRW